MAECGDEYLKGKEMIGDALYEMLYCGKQLPNGSPYWSRVTYLILDVTQQEDNGEDRQIFTRLYKNIPKHNESVCSYGDDCDHTLKHVEHVLSKDRDQVYTKIQDEKKGNKLLTTIHLIMNYSPCDEEEDGKRCCKELKDLFTYMTTKFEENGQEVKYVVAFTQLYHVNECYNCGDTEINANKKGLNDLNMIQDVELRVIEWPNLYKAITPYIPDIEGPLEADESLDVLRLLYNNVLCSILDKVSELNEDQLHKYLDKHSEQGTELQTIILEADL